jgi:hypothetical protein
VLLVLGLRLTVVHFCAAPVPYVDEWTAIGQHLLLPWQQGTLEWPALVALHNGEHRIVGTRLLELGLFSANGQWDPIVGMVVNALLVAATTAVWLGTVARERDAVTSALLVALLWALPFGYANLLWPFQSHVFLLLLATVVALREVSGLADPARVRWWVLAGTLTVAILSSGGGFITVIIVGAALLARVAIGATPVRMARSALAVAAAAAALGWWLASSPRGLPPWDAALLTFLKGASWPHSNLVLLLAGDAAASHYLPPGIPLAGTLQSWLGALEKNDTLLMAALALVIAIIWAPTASRAVALGRRRAPATPVDCFHLGLAAWVLATLAAIALKRATDYFVPTRYIDLLLPALAVNGWLALQSGQRWLRRLWLGVVGAGLLVTLAGVVVTQLPRRAAEGAAWMHHLTGYARHRDITRLQNLAPGQLPNILTDPAPLVAILDLPGFSALLVPELRAEPPRHGPLRRASRLLLKGGPFLAVAGLWLLVRAWWSEKKRAPA